MNWRLAAVPASMVPIAVIAVQFDVSLEDVLAVGAVPFAAAALVMMAKLGVQGAKFTYIARHYLGPIDTVWRMSGVRVGSEFIKFTTPMFVGAEFVVIYWMHKKGVPPSKAMWVAILDIVTEVLAGGLLSIMAGVVALLAGAYVVAAIILATSVSVTSAWVVMFFLSSKRTFQTPRAIARLAARIGGERIASYVKEADKWMAEVCAMSRENMSTRDSKKVFAGGLALSTVSWLFYGISFMIIAAGVGYSVGAFDSVMAVMGANAIGNLPITVGGSGLAEFGIVAYLENHNPFAFDVSEGALEWDAVIAWRIATYYVPIAVTWFLLMRLALGKYEKVKTAAAVAGGGASSASASGASSVGNADAGGEPAGGVSASAGSRSSASASGAGTPGASSGDASRRAAPSAFTARLAERERRENVELILRVAKGERKRRARARARAGTEPKTTLYQDVVHQIRHWCDDIPEDQIRAVMQEHSLLPAGDGDGDASSSSSAGDGDADADDASRPAPPPDSAYSLAKRLDRRWNVQTIKNVVERERKRREEWGTRGLTLEQAVVRQLKHWRPDIPEDDIRKVMRGETLPAGGGDGGGGVAGQDGGGDGNTGSGIDSTDNGRETNGDCDASGDASRPAPPMASKVSKSLSLAMAEWDKETNTEVILGIAKKMRRLRERDLLRDPDYKHTTTLVQDTIHHVRHWRDDISEADIRKVMRGESLLPAGDGDDAGDSGTAGRGGGGDGNASSGTDSTSGGRGPNGSGDGGGGTDGRQ